MSVKVDQTSAVAPQSIKMTATSASSGAPTSSGPKGSLFAAKSGFVIPKNKLSGSMVPIYKGGKKLGSDDVVSGESTSQVQRKTKWGPDLAQDAVVRRGRALAYQTRVDQIEQQLKYGIPEHGGDQDSYDLNEPEDLKSSTPQIDTKNSERLELEKREVIGEILKLNPSYKAPPDYKPLLKETAVPIPVKEYPGYNFIVLIFGHGNENLKRLEKETGAKIQVHGTKAHTGEKVVISSCDGNDMQVAYEELNVVVTADTFEKVDAAVSLIELLLTSISGNLAAEDKANVNQNQEATPSMVSTAVNQGVVQPVVGHTQIPQQGQFQYQNTWFPGAPPQVPVHPPSGLISPQMSSAPILNNPIHAQLSPINSSAMPSLFGPQPMQVFSNAYQPRNFPMPPPQPPFMGSQSQPTGPYSVARPQLLQPLSSGQPGSSSGWSLAPAGIPSSLGLSNMGQTTHPTVPSPVPSAAVPHPGFPYPVQSPNAANAVSPGTFSSGPSPLQLSSVLMNHPATPNFSVVLPPLGRPSSAPTAIQTSPLVTPLPNSSISPAIGSTAISSPMMPSPTLQSGVAVPFSGTAPNFTPTRPPTIPNAKVQHSGTGDFTFQPHHLQNPAPQIVPMLGSHSATQNSPLTRPTTQSATPQARPFHLDMPNSAPQPGFHMFPRPQVGNQLGQPPFVGNPSGASISSKLPAFSNASQSGLPVLQMGSSNFSPTSHLPNLAGPFPPRPGNPMQFQQNPFPPRPGNLVQPQQNYPTLLAPRGQSMPPNQPFNKSIPFASGRPASIPGQQIYDPFSPTSASIAHQQGGNPGMGRKLDNDPEYEDLMASVGVK